MAEWRRHFDDLRGRRPDLAEPHYNLALAYHKMGEHEEATTHFKKAAELAPNNSAITGSGVYKSHVKPARSSDSSGYY